jgi:hypothetical protein
MLQIPDELTDILDLKGVSKISMPMKESQMLRALCAFGVLADMVGVTSQLYRTYKKEVIDAYRTKLNTRSSRAWPQPPPKKNRSIPKCCVGCNYASKDIAPTQKPRWDW